MPNLGDEDLLEHDLGDGSFRDRMSTIQFDNKAAVLDDTNGDGSNTVSTSSSSFSSLSKRDTNATTSASAQSAARLSMNKIGEEIKWSKHWCRLLALTTTIFTASFIAMALSSDEQQIYFFYYLGLAAMPGSILIFDALTMSNPAGRELPYLAYYALFCIILQLTLITIFGPGLWSKVEGVAQGLGSFLIGWVAFKLRYKASLLPPKRLSKLVYGTLPNVFVSATIAIVYFSAEILPCISEYFIHRTKKTDIRTCTDTSSATFTFSMIFVIMAQISIAPPTKISEKYVGRASEASEVHEAVRTKTRGGEESIIANVSLFRSSLVAQRAVISL